MSRPGVVVKVGGSLFDHPRLFPCLNAWLSTLPRPVLIVPGGGAAAEAVRHWHIVHNLSEVDAHEIALASLKASYELFLRMIHSSKPTDGRTAVSEGILVVNVHAFGALSELPKSWAVTTDSLAAEIACYHQLDLILLKSVNIPISMTWTEASSQGYIDEYFPKIQKKMTRSTTVIDFRARMTAYEDK